MRGWRRFVDDVGRQQQRDEEPQGDLDELPRLQAQGRAPSELDERQCHVRHECAGSTMAPGTDRVTIFR